MILAHPELSNTELGVRFNRSREWIGRVRQSDLFKEHILARRQEIVDPTLIATVEERLRMVADASLEKLLDKLTKPADEIPDNLLIAAAQLGAKGLGVGGFASHSAPSAPPPAPPQERLERLRDRLLKLQGTPQEITDVRVVEAAPREARAA